MKLTKKQTTEIYYKNGNMKPRYEKVVYSFSYSEYGRPCQWTSRRTLEDITPEMLYLIKALDLKCTVGNDAKRDGLEGNYIKVTKKGREKILKLPLGI